MADLTTILTDELGTILPELTSSAASVIGAIAPTAMGIAGMVAVVGIVIGVFRKLLGR